jgi:phage baseplate assembly protein W
MIDLKLTNDGELVVAENGDLEIVFGDEQIAQEVLFRLKTTPGDWVLSPKIGVDLEKFIGQANVKTTHLLMETAISRALTYDNLLIQPSVEAIATGENEVFILIEFDSVEENNRVIQIQSGLDLKKGLVFAKLGSRMLQ